MTRLSYEVQLVVPTFLGGADQSGEWRVPPFKALLRHFWRMVVAKDCKYNWKKVRREEARMLGHAGLDQSGGGPGAQRSAVEMALDRWRPGTLTSWPGKDIRVTHPEVKPRVGSQLYLAYGPLQYDRGTKRTAIKRRPALAPDERAELRLRVPSQPQAELERVRRAMLLAHLFGAVGGRSRNGWGSFVLARDGAPLPGLKDGAVQELLASCSRPWNVCLALEWPHAIGTDDRGRLVWQTSTNPEWSRIVESLAEAKIALRTQFPLSKSPHREPLERHVLAYPVTRHGVSGWPGSARLANQIRFKIVPDGKGYRGIVAHFPARTPATLAKRHATRLEKMAPSVWPRVHAVLDRHFERVS